MSDMQRRSFLAGAGALGVALWSGPVLLRSAGAQAVPPTAPRLTYGPDAARTMCLGWSTPGGVDGIRAEVGLDAGLGTALPIETRVASGHAVRYHRASIDGLEPATTYHYRLGHAGADPVSGTFRTAPVERQAFRFVTFGDQGDGDAARAVNAVVTAQDPALVFLVGDLCYASLTGGTLPSIPGATALDHAVWDSWLDLISRSGAGRVPWLAGVGNHEIEDGQGDLGYDGYLARVPLPGNGPAGVPTVWSARHASVGFVNLDANDASHEIPRIQGFTAGAQDAWLDATLAGLRSDPAIDWIVVGFHHCAYCTNALHGSDAGVRERWGAMFDRHEVDLVVNGHNHCYERAHPLRAGGPVEAVAAGGTFDAARGTTYLTVGGGGQTGYPAALGPIGLSTVSVAGGARIPEPAPWAAFQHNDNSLLVVDVDPGSASGPTTMLLRALGPNGRELDRFTLARARPGVASTPLAPPAAAGGPSPAPEVPAASGGRLAATGGGGPPVPAVIAAMAAAGLAVAARQLGPGASS